MTKTGPKTGASSRPLIGHGLPPVGAERVCAWIEKFILVTSGEGARKALHVYPWQREMIRSAFDTPRPRLGLWSFPRGNGKSSLAAALSLYGLHGVHVESSSVCVGGQGRAPSPDRRLHGDADD